MGAVVSYAARIISHTSPWWAVGNGLMIGEDVKWKLDYERRETICQPNQQNEK